MRCDTITYFQRNAALQISFHTDITHHSDAEIQLDEIVLESRIQGMELNKLSEEFYNKSQELGDKLMQYEM